MIVLLLAGSQPAIAASSDEEIVAKINAFVKQGWVDNGVTSSERADDGEYARRVSLDVVGRIPSYQRLVQFLNDSSPDKRARLVDELFDDPDYAEQFSTIWGNLLIGRANNRRTNRGVLERWIKRQFEKNARYDQFVKPFTAEQLYDSLLVATEAHKAGRNFEQSERQRTEWLGQFVRTFGTDENDEASSFNGTVPQALVMMNGELVKNALSGANGSFLRRVLEGTVSKPDDAADKNKSVRTTASASKTKPVATKPPKTIPQKDRSPLSDGPRPQAVQRRTECPRQDVPQLSPARSNPRLARRFLGAAELERVHHESLTATASELPHRKTEKERVMSDQSLVTMRHRWTASELRKLPEHERNAILEAAAAAVEAEYRNNPELTDFEAFGKEGLHGDSANAETR